MKRVVIFGGSGFIGKHLVNELSKDYEVVVVSRFKKTTSELFDGKIKVVRLRKTEIGKIVDQINGSYAIINLAGESVGRRWTERRMEKIRKSRLNVDSTIVRAIRLADKIPEVVMLGSAIGIYGYSRTDIEVNEETTLGQRGFLPKIAVSHEEAFHQLEKITRVIYLRTGMVLSLSGGALPKIAQQTKLFAGGKIGNGKQWQSWIHIYDEVEAIRYLMENNKCKGAYNLTAPNPVQNKEFTKLLGKTLSRPVILPIPKFFLRLILGTMANELLISGVKVVPARLLEEGFTFKYNELNEALNQIFQKN